MPDIKDIAASLDELLSKTNLSKVTAAGAGFEELKDGFYPTEVNSIELKVNKNGDPMVSAKCKVVDDGWCYDEEGDTYGRVAGSKNRIIFKNWNLVTEQDIKRFVSDMLKFENPDVAGEALVEMLKQKPEDDIMDYFKTTEFLLDVLGLIQDFKSRIYIQISSYEKNGETRTQSNLVKWSVIDQISQDYNIAM